ncbi:MAG TPA: SMP-30/gluconolactonase/LRE family protein [Gemmatimonadaceae bacterium]|nr:SMP-30/gluconolactonase/LRE family protein [Gemmatimonadaceae bacterium]
MSRHVRLIAALTASVAASPALAQNAARATPIAPAAGSRIERLDPAFDALVPRDAKVEKLAEGFDWTEGPLWRKSGSYLLFSDVPRNTIYKWKEGEGLSIFIRPAGYAAGTNPPGRELGTNGLTFDAQGRLVVADHGNRGISRWNDSLFTRTVVADRFEGKRFNSPNDLVWAPNGDLYFTDPSYGLRRLNDDPAKELPYNGVYRLAANGKVTLLTRELTFPNGIALSPDARTLYVAISDGKMPYIMAYDVQSDGNVARGRIFYDAKARVEQKLPGALDGLKVDAKGNVFATGPGGILVLSPAGKHLGTIFPGDVVANCAFGDDGSTLYMTVNHQLMRVRTSTKGQGF